MARCGNCLTISRGEVASPRTCGSCNHPIVFDKRRDGITDVKLVRAMARLSADGALAYTENQLFHAVAGRQQRKPGLLKRLGGGEKPPAYWEPTIDRGPFMAKFQTWRQLHGRVHGALVDDTVLRNEPNRQAGGGLPAEITVHSFDRVVIVDNVATAVMLVENNFHVDHRCAVFSEDGYPEGFRTELIQLLRTNPNLAVIALHGATSLSIGMAERLRAWFPDTRVRIVDAGFRPAQADTGRIWSYRTDQRKEPDAAMLAAPNLGRLTEAEQQWLAWGLFAPLDSIGPTAVVNMLTKIFNGLSRMDEDAAGRPHRDAVHDDYWAGYTDNHGVIWLDGGADALGKGLGNYFDGDLDSSDLFGDG